MEDTSHIRMMAGLFWSNSGEIACARHAPESGGTRWLEERWQPLFALPTAGTGYRCQSCRREELHRRHER